MKMNKSGRGQGPPLRRRTVCLPLLADHLHGPSWVSLDCALAWVVWAITPSALQGPQRGVAPLSCEALRQWLLKSVRLDAEQLDLAVICASRFDTASARGDIKRFIPDPQQLEIWSALEQSQLDQRIQLK